jgi:type IV pilus assembly protein PilW
MTMSLVVMGAIYSLFTTQQKSYIHQERVATIQQNLRSAMMMMERDIRLAGCNPTGTINPAPGIVTPTSGTPSGNTCRVTMDIIDTAGTPAPQGKPDGKLDGPNEDVTYTLNGTNLTRNGVVVAEYIQALTFTILDVDGNGTFETVQVNMTAQTTREAKPTTRSLVSNIKCRNLDLSNN